MIWVSEGIRRVSSDTTSSLAEQRRRIAWLFRDTRLADVVVADVVVGLLPWLPAEDWTPVIRAHASDTTMLKFIHRMALREGRNDVACRVAKALDIPCTAGGRTTGLTGRNLVGARQEYGLTRPQKAWTNADTSLRGESRRIADDGIAVRLSTLLLLCGFAAGASSSVFAGSPTDDAFDALLSIPQAAAEDGEWNHSAPEGFDIDGGEDALIEWLTASKEEGADFAELRHQGSLLHHAIRAGLDRTALWLLAQGANPLQTLDNASEGADALAIAIEHRRWPVIEVLLKRADVTAAARRTKLASTWLSLPVAATDADIARLSALKLPLPEGKLANALLYNALIRRWYGLALTLAEHGATPPDGLRPRAELNTQPLQTETIERLDARLTVPLFAYLAAQPTDRKEVDTIWALRVRKPFEDAAFTRSVVIAVLDTSRTAEMRTATLQHIPAAALTAALADGEVFKRWIKWAITLPTADSEWAFAATGNWPRERPVEFVEALRSSASWYHATPKNPALDDAWRRTLARLPKPIPAALNGQLWMFVPFDQRGDLLALGYVPGNQELAYWLDRDSVDNLRTVWPAMKATVPDIGPRIHAALIGDCVLGQRDGTMRLDERVLEKSRVLSEGGARPAQPLILDSACRGNADKAALAGLEQDGIVATAPPLRNDRFRIPAKTCRFEPDARWRDALLSNHQVGSFEAVGAQLVPLPGSDECGVLVWGGTSAAALSSTRTISAARAGSRRVPKARARPRSGASSMAVCGRPYSKGSPRSPAPSPCRIPTTTHRCCSPAASISAAVAAHRPCCSAGTHPTPRSRCTRCRMKTRARRRITRTAAPPAKHPYPNALRPTAGRCRSRISSTATGAANATATSPPSSRSTIPFCRRCASSLCRRNGRAARSPPSPTRNCRSPTSVNALPGCSAIRSSPACSTTTLRNVCCRGCQRKTGHRC